MVPVKLDRLVYIREQIRHIAYIRHGQLTWASNLTRISLLFRSRPVILTLRYGSVFSNLVPSEPIACEIRPGSGCPYICGSLPYSPSLGDPGPFCGVVGGSNESARPKFVNDGVECCGLVGHDGFGSSFAKGVADSLSGSNIMRCARPVSAGG